MTAREQRRARVLTRILRGELTMAEGGTELGLSERQLWRLRSAFVGGDRPGSSTATGADHRPGGSTATDGPGSSSCASGMARSTTATSTSSSPSARGSSSAGRACGRSCAARASPVRAGGARRGIAADGHGWAPKAPSSSSTAAATAGSRRAGPELVLVGAIDDATGLVTAAVFRDQEDAAGYLEILFATIEAYGLPGAIYRDGHSAFAPSSPARHPLADDDPALSQVGRALVELDIDSILAGSAQAKGRIERLWGTFQDRLVVELRLAGVVDRAGANAFLVDYLPRHNARFVVPAADPVPAWRTLPDDVRLERVLVFKYRRKVARDHTISLAGRILQLPRGATGRANYAGKRVEVHVALDGSIGAYDGERRLAVLAAPPDPVQLRTEKRQRVLPSLMPRGRYDPLDTTSRPSMEAAHPWEQAREATDRITRQLS